MPGYRDAASIRRCGRRSLIATRSPPRCSRMLRAVLKQRRYHRPVGRTSHAFGDVHRLRKQVVDEHDAVADEPAVADCHAGADDRVARDLALLADDPARLDLDERLDLGGVAYRA